MNPQNNKSGSTGADRGVPAYCGRTQRGYSFNTVHILIPQRICSDDTSYTRHGLLATVY